MVAAESTPEAVCLACTYAESTRAITSAESTVPAPLIVIVLVAPLPVAVTPSPTKFKVVPVVDKGDPSSCTLTPVAVIRAATKFESTMVPRYAESINASNVAESKPPANALTLRKLSVPLPSVVTTWLVRPSAVGNFNPAIVAESALTEPETTTPESTVLIFSIPLLYNLTEAPGSPKNICP